VKGLRVSPGLGDARVRVDPDGDIEEAVMRRLAVLPPPSAHAIAAGSRRDVVREDELAMQIYSISRQMRREISVRIAWLARRLRRELGDLAR
jgi:hypothetical protein